MTRDALTHLIARWRAKASDLSPFDSGAALAFTICARELETALGGQADVGEEFVRQALTQEPGLSSAELRERARSAGVSTTSVTRALPVLVGQGLVGFEVASRNRKRWHWRDSEPPEPRLQHDGSEQPIGRVVDTEDGAEVVVELSEAGRVVIDGLHDAVRRQIEASMQPETSASEPSVSLSDRLNGAGETEGQECRECDGCGWYEGGAALKTQCYACGGTGVQPAKP